MPRPLEKQFFPGVFFVENPLETTVGGEVIVSRENLWLHGCEDFKRLRDRVLPTINTSTYVQIYL